jgi:hypothetical protein
MLISLLASNMVEEIRKWENEMQVLSCSFLQLEGLKGKSEVISVLKTFLRSKSLHFIGRTG